MKLNFNIKLIGSDSFYVVYDTENDDWNEFYKSIVEIKQRYLDSVKEVTHYEKSEQKKSDVKPDKKSESAEQQTVDDTILPKAKNTESRPISENQKNILRRFHWTEKDWAGMSMAQAGREIRRLIHEDKVKDL